MENTKQNTKQNTNADKRNQRAERYAEHGERMIDAAWIDLCAARNDYYSLPHNAPAWLRRRDYARLERVHEAYERTAARYQ